jgi:hypothetical protein
MGQLILAVPRGCPRLSAGLFEVLTLVDGAKRPAESRPAGRIACPHNKCTITGAGKNEWH